MNELNNTGSGCDLSSMKLPDDLKNLDMTQCACLCQDIRQMLIETISATGGHLASNLGVVELTMALHRCFNSPEDKIIWDVGHQCYVHKILTGRASQLSTIRQKDGISGFPKPEESPHDTYIAGHSSTSVSVACGIAKAMQLQGKDNYTIAVIGDGAMTGGMFYEAMNNCGHASKLIVVLNDNNMSISKSVGSLQKYLTTLRNSEKYIDTKRKVEKTLTQIPVVGTKAAKGIKMTKDSLKSTLLGRTMFEDMGFVYLGPVNGHNQAELERVIGMAKTIGKPVLIHVKTKKGKGYPPAEENPGEYHGIPRFDIATGNPEVSPKDSYSSVFGKELCRLAERDDRICAITAAMKYGTGLQYFRWKFPERFFDVGIAEQHAATFAGGLASMGQIPVFAVYSTFLQRAYDQLLHDIAIGGYHVVLGVDRAGIVGEDGETHQGMFDVPMLTTIPGTVIYSPSCYEELRVCLKKAIFAYRGLVAVRYPRGSENVSFNTDCLNTEYLFMRKGISDTLIITYGRLYNEAYIARNMLAEQGTDCDILKLTKIFPIAGEIISEISGYKRIVFFEESVGEGSISEKFGLKLLESGYRGDFSRVAAEGFQKQDTVSGCLEKLGLTAGKMAEFILAGGKSDAKA